MKRQNDILNKLIALRSSFGDDFAFQKSKLLREFSVSEIRTTKELFQWHEHLLFMKAYPDSALVLSRVNKQLNALIKRCNYFFRKNRDSYLEQFNGTGIPYSNSIWRPSLAICNWLYKNYKSDISLNVDDEFIDAFGPLMPLLCKPLLQDGLTDSRYDPGDWLRLASDKKAKGAEKLKWILDAFNALDIPDAIKEHLFDTALIEITHRLTGNKISRSSNNLSAKVYFQNAPLLKKPDVGEVLNSPLKNFKKLRGNEKSSALDSAKAMLAVRDRETDPVSYASEVYKTELEHGLSILIFEMLPEKKLPIEAYLGFAAYRNGVPVAYGGGWILYRRCEIGVNVFDTFRGGENNLIFINIMRVYYQLFGITKFVVQPYQFGEDNEEGLKSGAYWFYHRLGFRLKDHSLAKKAAKEYDKILKNSSYRSPLKTLKEFTGSPVILDTGKKSESLEPKQISIAVTKQIARKFEGNSAKANFQCSEKLVALFRIKDFPKWPESEQQSFENFSALIAMLPGLASWTKKSKSDLIELIRLKARDEIAFAKKLNEHQQLRKALLKIIN